MDNEEVGILVGHVCTYSCAHGLQEVSKVESKIVVSEDCSCAIHSGCKSVFHCLIDISGRM